MKINYNQITIYIMADYKEMSHKAASVIVNQINLKTNSILGLATGSTPEKIYEVLVDWHQQRNLDFSEVTTFNLDEYRHLSSDHPQSYAFYMYKHLFGRVNIQRNKIHIPSGTIACEDETCRIYDDELKAYGPIDLQLLGIGHNGHIGFNEPGDVFTAHTHIVHLDPSTICANARFFDRIEDMPKEAVSMGVHTIMQAKSILLVASGTEKADILEMMLFGPITPQVPASILQLHQKVSVVIDQKAAKKIIERLKVRGDL